MPRNTHHIHPHDATLTPTTNLTPHPDNPRQGDIGAITESIKHHGWYGTLIAQKSTGHVLAGNHRLQAAIALGITHVPVTYLDVTDEQARRILIADNRTSDLATYDDEQLSSILQELATDGGLDGTGYDGDDLDTLINDLGGANPSKEAPAAQLDKADELREKWSTALGQLWQIGPHRLLCGDSTDPEAVARLMAGACADAVLTDPPYGQNQPGVSHDAPEELPALIAGVVANIPMDNGAFVAFQSPRTFPVLLDAGRDAGFRFERMLWLYKAAQMTFPWRGWILKSEAIVVFTRGEAKWQEVNPYAHDCYYMSEVSERTSGKVDGWHGSIKPYPVVEDVLKRITPKGGAVYEPFAGSGTTMAAAAKLGRVGYGVEIEPQNVAIILQRFADMGLKPELVE